MTRAALALPLALVAALALAQPARAVPLGAPRPLPSQKPTSTPPPVAPPVGAPATTGATGVLGSADVLQGLGAVDANCKQATGQVAENCQSDGFAATAFPPSNTSLDVNVNRGLDSPQGWVMGPLQDILSAVFEVFVYIVTGILMLLALAMSFDIFRSNAPQITHLLNSALGSVTWPLMGVALIVLALIAAWHVGQRQIGRAAIYLLGGTAAMAATIAVLSAPASLLGPVDDFANGLTSILPGALSGQAPTTGGFAQATPTIWRGAIETPWCALEFGSVTWCMHSISPTMAQARNDVIANHLDQTLGNQDVNGVMAKDPKAQAQERLRLQAAKTNGELFLSFLTNSDVRNGKNDGWSFYNAAAKDPTGGPALLTIRGPGGWGTRVAIVLFGCVAGVFFVISMLYIAWQVAVQAVWIVILLFLGVLALLAAAFGVAGMRAFAGWWQRLLGAFLIKVVYAAYLGAFVALSGLVLLLNLAWFADWAALALVWSLCWFKRKALLEMLSGGQHSWHDHSLILGATAGAVGSRAAGYVLQRRAVRQGVQEAAYHEHHEGDTHQYNLHVHADGNGNGNHPDRVDPVPDVIDGHARELDEG